MNKTFLLCLALPFGPLVSAADQKNTTPDLLAGKKNDTFESLLIEWIEFSKKESKIYLGIHDNASFEQAKKQLTALTPQYFNLAKRFRKLGEPSTKTRLKLIAARQKEKDASMANFSEWYTRISKQPELVAKIEKLEDQQSAARKTAKVIFDNYFQRDPNAALTVEAMHADLDQLKQLMTANFSYLQANSVDLNELFNKVKKGIDGPLNQTQFASRIQLIISHFIDGHAGVRKLSDGFEKGYLPFMTTSIKGRIIAIRRDFSDFVDKDYPYLSAIDGKPIEQWMKAVSIYVPKGSPQYQHLCQLNQLRYIQHSRSLMGLPMGKTLQVTMENEQGKKKTITLSVAKKKSFHHGVRPIDFSKPFKMLSMKKIEGNIAYFKILQMEPHAPEHIKKWMHQIKDTDGLVIDLRDNPGGTRHALFSLFPYLMNKEDQPRILNVAKYRKSELTPDDCLESRMLYRENSPKLGEAKRKAIQAFKKTFRAEWQTPDGKFSDWHYMLVSKSDDPSSYHYDKPVVVLMNDNCYSATDIFLGGIKGWRNVTLMGTSSGGGSARSSKYELPLSGVKLKLGSMASFQPNGQLYDTRGVSPDVVIHPTLDSLILHGDDNVLNAAVKAIQSKN